jgi:hypothetical protein
LQAGILRAQEGEGSDSGTGSNPTPEPGISGVQVVQSPAERSVFALGETLTFALTITEEGDNTKTYSWRKVQADGNDEEVNNGQELELIIGSLADSGRYYCIVTDVTNSSMEHRSDTVTIFVEGIGSVSIANPPDGAFNLGETVTFTLNITEAGTIEKEYLWKRIKVGGDEILPEATGNSLTLDNLSLADTGRYYCVVTDKSHGNTEYASDVISVRVEGIVAVRLKNPPAGALAIGGTFTLELNIEEGGDHTKSYSWRRVNDEGEDEILAVSGESLIFQTLSLADTGRYYCIVTDRTDSYKTYFSDTAIIRVTGIASIQVQCDPDRLDFVVGEPVTFTLGIIEGGNSSKTYSWRKVGDDTPIGNQASLTLPDLLLSHTGSYYCVVTDQTNPENPYYSDQRAIQVEGIGSVQVEQLSGRTTFVLGESIAFAVTVTQSGVDNFSYAWKKAGNGESVLSTESSLVLNDVSLADAGRYYCEVTDNTHPSAVGNPYKSNEYTIDVLAISAKVFGFTRLCVGDSARYALALSSEGEYTYRWFKVGGSSTPVTTTTWLIENLTTAHSGKYYCLVRDVVNGFEISSDTLDVLVSEYPVVGLTVNGTSPANRTATFCYDSDVSLAVVNQAPGQPEAIVFWTGTSLQGDPEDVEINFRLKYTSLYRAVITNNGCIREDSVRIVMKQPQVMLPESRYAITGESVTLASLAPENPDYRFYWNYGGQTDVFSGDTYTFTAEEGTTLVSVKVQTFSEPVCTNYDTCSVTGLPVVNYTTSINDGYVVSRSPLRIIQNDTVLCARTDWKLEVAYTGYDGYTYEWLKVGAEEVLATGRILALESLEETNRTDYFCRAYDLEKGGYVYSDTVAVVVKYRPVASITGADEETPLCGGYPLTLTGGSGLVNDPPAVTYHWQGAGMMNSANSKVLNVKISTDGYYSLIVSANGCSDTAELHIPTIVHYVDIPAQLILPSPTNGVHFTAEKPEDGYLTWFIQGTSGERMEVETGTTASASLNIRGGDKLVIAQMHKNGCDFRDTCRVLIREFAEPIGNESDYDDGFAISYPDLRVTNPTPMVCRGQDVTLSVYNEGYDNYKYKWYKEGVTEALPDSEGSSYTIYRARAGAGGDGGRYYCVATDPAGRELVSNMATLTVQNGPLAEINFLNDEVIDRSGGLIPVCYGSTIYIETGLSYVMSGGGSHANPEVADKLLWTGEGIVSGQGTDRIEVKVGNTAYFTLTASKNAGCSSQDTITFRVVKPEVSLASKVLVREEDAEITFNAASGQTVFTWFKNGEQTPDENATATMLFDADGYVVVTVGEEGCLVSDTAKVFIRKRASFAGGANDGFSLSRPALVIPGTLKQIAACPDEQITLHTQHAEYSNYKYEWWREMNGYSPQLVHTGAVYTFTMDQNGFLAGRYYCTVINPDFGEDDPRRYLYSDTLEITHRVGPFTQISPNKTELCAGELLELDATASASGAGQVSYTWSGEGVTEENNGASGILSVYPQRSGVYSVEVRNQNCSDTASIAITVSRPQITLPALIKLPAPAFNYDVSTLRPEGVATVIWSFRSDVGHTNSGNGNQLNIDGDGWIVASLQDAESGCAAVDSCRVFVKDIYSFGGGADDGFSVLEVNTRVWMEPRQEEITLCLDQQLLLRAAVSGVGRYTYSWHRVEDDVAGKPGKVLGTEERWVIDYITDADAGSYYCIVTDQEENDLEGGGKKQYRTENIRLIVTPGPIAKIAQLQGGVNWSACVGETIELLGSLAPESPVQGDVQYTWSGDYFEESETPEIIYARPRRDGLYILKISHSQTGCADTVHARFLMRSPQVSLPSTITMLKPGMLQIEAESNEEGRFQWYRDVYPSNILSYVNPANLDVKQDASVIVRFDQDGCYGFDTTQVFVRMDAAFRGGDDDGFLASDIHLVAQVGRKRQEVCRGALIEIPLRVAEVGRVLRYNWFKVGDYTVRSREKNLVLPANEVSDGGQYYCVVSDPSIENLAKGSVWSDTATVVVLNGPQAKISEPNEIRLANIFCKGVDVLISAQATESRKTNNNDVYTYEWFGENISYVARDYEINAKMGNNGRYIVKASMDGCSTYDTIDIKIYEPEIELTPVIYLSKPGPVSLSVNNPEENVIRWYQYTQGGYSVGAPVTGNSWSANILEDSYVVAERIKDGCLGYDTSRIFVKSVFSFLGGEEDGFMSAGSGYYNRRIEFTDYICEGDLATLFVQVVGDDFYRYKWVKVGDESREFTSSSLCKIENVKKSDEGYYYCIITDVNNSKTLITDRIYMHVKEKPRTSITIPDTEICYGQMAVLKADISSLATGVNYSYLWSGKGAASATDSVLNVQVYEAGDYVLYVSDGDCFTTDTISLNVRKTHLDIPTEYHIKQGDRLILHGKVNGSPAELLNWQIGNNPYRDRNPLVLESSSLSKTQPFTVSTAGKCVVTVNGMIYVRENTAYFGGYDDGFVLPNDLPQVLDQCGQLLGCDVDTALLWVKVVETEDLTVRWEKFYENLGYWDVFEAEGKSNVSGFENDSLVFTSIMDVDEGRYRCRLQNAYGTVFSREIRLVKGGIPQIIAPLNSVPICEKNEISFITDVRIPQNGTRTGLTWKWYFSKDGLNFAQLLPVADFTDRSMSIPDCRENNEGYYRVEASNYCGSVLDTAFQEVWEKPRFVAQPTNQYVCDKGLIRLTTAVEGGGTYTYALWQVEVDAQGKYVRDVRRVRPAIADPSYTFTYVMLEDDGYYQWRVYNECDSTRSNPFHLIVEEEIRPNFTAIDTTLCVGFNERFTLSVNNSNVANPTSTMIYYWTKQTATRGETNLSGTGTKHELINMQDTVAGVYICYVKHSCAAKPIKQYNIKTHTRPKITLDLTTSPIEHCLSSKNISMFLDYTSDATAGEVKFTWSHNNSRKLTDDGHYKGTTTPRLTIDSLLASDNGTYSVVLENVCGTTLSGQATVRVKMPPAYTRTLADQSTNLCVGENLALRVEATGEAPIMYIWTKGNDVIGSNSPTLNLNAVTHDFTGTYCCEIQNECTLEGVRTCAEVDVITPHLFDLQIVDAKGNVLKSGGYCAEDFLDLRLSGFDERAVYTLKRRTRLDNTNYTTLAVVSGATAGDYVSFGKWGEGYYHVEAEVKIGNKSCKLIMKNVDVHLFQHPTPKVFPFYVSDPICGDETEGALTLAGTENNLDVKYSLQYYNARYSSWIDQKNQSGTGSSYTWPATSQGAYRMIAQNTVSGCTVLMGQDTLIPRPYPVIYDFVALRGDTTACFNMESDVVLQLKNSESGTGYTLMKKSESGNWESTGRYTTGGDALEWEKLRGGEYTVWAESNYGCRQEMGNIRVTDLPQLEVYSLQSGIVYCEEQVDETFAVVLEGSTKGIQYDFYARSNGSRVHTAVGTDSSLIYNVVLNKDETYYVVATDVAEGCKQAMNGETVIEANHLTIAVDESQTIDITTSTILPVSIQGEMGAVSVAWQPSSRIRSVDPETHYATTRPLDFGEQFLVTVKDDFCTKEAVTRVNVVGQALVVEIRKSDCYTPFNDSQDTLFLCRGEAVNLCAYMSGGTTYQIKWTDDYYSDSIPNSGKSKLSYTRQVDRDGFIVFHARAQIIGIKGDVVTQEKSDTLWVKVREIPAIQFGMEDLTCVVPGEEAAIVLSDSEEGVEYALSYRPAANARYTAFGEPQTSGANGEEIRFPIEAYSDTEHAGYYQVTARKTHASHDATVCVIQSLPVELRRAPRTYTISGNDRELLSSYCAGDSPDSIYVSSSEVNVTYRLMRQNLTTGSTAVTIAQATGTGEELLFTGSNGMGGSGGNKYGITVVAVLGRCSAPMDNMVTIDVKARPGITVQNVEGMKNFCDDKDEIKVVILDPKNTVTYTLYKDGFDEVIAQDAASWDSQTIDLVIPRGEDEHYSGLIGSYTLVALDPANLCTDTVRGLVVSETPGQLSIYENEDHEYVYCPGEAGVDGTQIRFTGANPLIPYQLRKSNSDVVGNFIHTGDGTIYYDGILTVPDGSSSITYEIHALVEGCPGKLGGFTIRKGANPGEFSLLGSLLGCDEISHNMGVKATSVGYTYTLYKEGGDESLGDPQPGGGDIYFESQSSLGTYYVILEDILGCTKRLTEQYVIRPRPDMYRITTSGDSTYCEGSQGIQLGIENTQQGIVYTLQREELVGNILQYRDIPGIEIIGTSAGGASTFGGYYTAGKYRIRTDYCNITMPGVIEVIRKNLPLQQRLAYSGSCVDSSMYIEIATPEPGTQYTLLFNGASANMEVLSGTVNWTIAKAQDGIYTVLADRQGCTLLMEDEIVPGTSPKIGDLLGIAQNLCHMTLSDLYLSGWDEGSTYKLYVKGDDTKQFSGVQSGDSILFTGVPAGFNYYISATHRSCTIEKGAFEYPGKALPKLLQDMIEPIDCQRDGEGIIKLKNLKPSLTYLLSGALKTDTIKNFSGDTLLQNLTYGAFTLTATDPVTTCVSLPLEVTLRRGVPADSIISRLQYCVGALGVQIQLSGQNFGVTYSLCNAAGEPLGAEYTIQNTTSFVPYLKAGTYIFRKERLGGLWSGCKSEETFVVEEYPIPNNLPEVELPSGTLCEAGNNRITIHNSEPNVHYMLQNTTTNVYVDTIYGNGGTIVFEDRKPKGTYRLQMRYGGLCPATYYRTIEVSDVPPAIVAADCEYCYDHVSTDGCELAVSGLRETAEYILYNAEDGLPRDTLYGVNAGYFDAVPEGNYYVTGTYANTSCADVVAQMSVHRLTEPIIYTVANANGTGDCGTSAEIILQDGWEGDSVKYTLYLNGFLKMAGPITATQFGVRFPVQNAPGTYTVYATKGVEEKCGVWMNGQVVLYAPPANGVLSVRGYNCDEALATDVSKVTISATKAERNWFYYITDGIETSEKKAGLPNVQLSWDQINGRPLASGHYYLYADNGCGNNILMDSVWVRDAVTPAPVSLLRRKNGVFCNNWSNGYECILNTSERLVTYELAFSSTTYKAEGTGAQLAMGFAPSGLVSVYATSDTTGCTYLMDTLRVVEDYYTSNPGFSSSDICSNEGGTITITMGQPRVPQRDYYLRVNGHNVDTIPAETNGSVLSFKPQNELGCYELYTTSKTGQCDTVYPARCLSLGPEPRTLKGSEWDGKLCQGDLFKVVVETPQPGVYYQLFRNGTPHTSPVQGFGDTLLVGTIATAGEYTVKAFVTDACSIDLETVFRVEVLPRPELNLVTEYVYPQGGEGVEIVVDAPTSEGVWYQIEQNGSAIDWRQAFGASLSLGQGRKAGVYVIKTFELSNPRFQCVSQDTVVVKELGLENFTLGVVGTPYKCDATECRVLRLSGTEKGVTYQLHRRTIAGDQFIAELVGNGRSMDFNQQCDTGFYYVIAAHRFTDPNTGQEFTASSQMGDGVRLYTSTRINKYLLESETQGYCHRSGEAPSGSVLCSGSQSEVTYYLYRDGNLVPGQERYGNGSPLRWGSLEGKPCINNSDDGYVYTVRATDGRCEVQMAGEISIIATNQPAIRKQTYSLNECTGSTVAMAADVTGCLLTYEWRFNGQVVSRESSHVIEDLQQEDMGTYECTVSNYCGSVNLQPIPVEVRGVVTVPDQLTDAMVCGDGGSPIELVSGATGENAQYSWYLLDDEAHPVSSDRIYTIENPVKSLHEGVYVCKTWNTCGAVFDTVRLDFNREPVVEGFIFREQTLCKGSSWQIELTSPDTLFWYHNDVLIPDKKSRSLKFDSIVPVNEGLYKVVAKNICNQKEFNIVRLLVDDTLYVASAFEKEKHYCNRSPIEMAIMLRTPEGTGLSRVNYFWTKREMPIANAVTNQYTVGSSLADDGVVFAVYYNNACTSGDTSQTVYIDQPVDLKNLTADVIECTTVPGMTQIQVIDQAQDDPSYNKYSWYKQGTPDVLVGETAFLQVERKVVNSGKYYSIVENACSRATSTVMNLWIDSIPVITQQPQSAEACANQTLILYTQSTGGNVEYRWYVRKRGEQNGSLLSTYRRQEYSSQSQLTREMLTLDYDSCQIWCTVENGCGYVSTDTIVIRVKPEVTLLADRTLASLCSNASDEVKVVLRTSDPACTWWRYQRSDAGSLVNVFGSVTDTLRFTQAGEYVISDFAPGGTAFKCYKKDVRIEISIQERELFYASLERIGKETICRGEKVQLRLKIEGGEAPWRVDIRRASDRRPAPEVGGVPVEVWSRDTTFNLQLIDNQEFYIESVSQFQDPNACVGEIAGNSVSYIVEHAYGTYLGIRSGDTKDFGVCNNIDLSAVLKPYPAYPVGKFYVNGQLLEGNQLNGLSVGAHDILYKAVTPAGCADSVSETLHIHAAPGANFFTDKNALCTGETAHLTLEFSGTGPFTYSGRTYSYNSSGGVIGRPLTWGGTVDNYMTSSVFFDEKITADSMRKYELMSVKDAFGCTANVDNSIQLLFHYSPKLYVQVSNINYNNGAYTEAGKTFTVPTGSRVNFRFGPRPQITPWNGYITYTNPMGVVVEYQFLNQTVKELTRYYTDMPGLWNFTISDSYCPSTSPIEKEIISLDTGYLQVSVMLQGAYVDDGQGKMQSKLWPNQLPKKTWGVWPSLGGRTAIDWIILELRTGSVNGSKFYSGEFLLLDDGTIIDRAGRSTLPIPLADFVTDYYIVVKHRNHLAIGSSRGHKLASSASAASLVDLSLSANIHVDNTQGDMTNFIKFLGVFNGKQRWAMYAGNVLENSLISIANPNTALLYEKSTDGYYLEDVNFDGKVTIPINLQSPSDNSDVSIMFKNRFIYSLIVE